MDLRGVENFRQNMDDLELPYEREMLTTWEQSFYEDMLENLADPTYRFTDKQIDQVERMRAKYELDIEHGEALR